MANWSQFKTKLSASYLFKSKRELLMLNFIWTPHKTFSHKASTIHISEETILNNSKQDDTSTLKLDHYFNDLEVNIKIYQADKIVELLHKLVHFQKEHVFDGFDILINEHSELFEKIISKLNKEFRDTGDSHLLLFEVMWFLNSKFNFNTDNSQNKVSELWRINIFKIYNRCRRVITKGDDSYYSEIFRQNAPLRQNIFESNPNKLDDGSLEKFIKDNYLFKVAEFFLKNAFMNPFGSRIEQLHPLYIKHAPTEILYWLSMLCSSSDLAKTNQSLIDLLIEKFNNWENNQLFEKSSIMNFPQLHSCLWFLDNFTNNVIKHQDLNSINENLKSLFIYILQTVLNQVNFIDDNSTEIENWEYQPIEIGWKINKSSSFLVHHPYSELKNTYKIQGLSKSQILDKLYSLFSLPGFKRVITDVVDVQESEELWNRLVSQATNHFKKWNFPDASYELKRMMVSSQIWTPDNWKDFADYLYHGGTPEHNHIEVEVTLDRIYK